MVMLIAMSCEKKYPEPEMSNASGLSSDFSAFTLASPASGANVEVDVANTTGKITISWNRTMALDKSDITYRWLAVAANTPTFATPVLNVVSDTIGKAAQLTFTHAQLDNVLQAQGIQPGQSLNLKWTVRATSASGKMVMATSAHNVTLYRKPQYPLEMRLIGGGSSAGWNPPTSIPMKKLADGIFEIYAYIDGDFKFVPTTANYDGDWGRRTSTVTSVTNQNQINGLSTDQLNANFPGYQAELIQDGEDNCSLPSGQSAGFYRITLNFVSTPKKLEMVKVNWGIIGSGTPGGWGSQTDMSIVNVGGTPKGSYQLSVTANLTAGNEMKFRAGDWPINFGGASGSMTYGGGNIAVTQGGSKTITLNLDPTLPNYTYTIQ